MLGGDYIQDVAHGTSASDGPGVGCLLLDAEAPVLLRQASAAPHLGQLALRPIPGEGTTGARPSQAGVEVVAGSRADRGQRPAGPRPRTVGLSEEKV
jgi:hypothetical protein